MTNGIPVEIDRETVQDLFSAGARLVDVLSAEQYRRSHLAGARHIPLQAVDAENLAEYARDEPIIVYCHDYQ